MAESKIVFPLVGNMAKPAAGSTNLTWIDENTASVPFRAGDKVTVVSDSTEGGDILLAFSPEAVEALAIYDDNPCTVTPTSPLTFEVVSEPPGNCSVTVTPATWADDSPFPAVEAGILVIRWPGPRDPPQT